MDKIIYIGIDPGQKGAVAMVWPHNHIEVHDMPCDKDGEINVIKIAEQIYPLDQNIFDGRVRVYIEKAVMFRGQGAGSSGSYMKGYGKILGMLEIMKLNYVEVHPRTWKSKFKLTKDKHDSITKAEVFAPHVKFMTDRGRMLDGRAEAILIAKYGEMIGNADK